MKFYAYYVKPFSSNTGSWRTDGWTDNIAICILRVILKIRRKTVNSLVHWLRRKAISLTATHLHLCQISLQYLYGEISPKYVKYYAFVTFYCPVLSWLYYFFSQLCPGGTPGRILTIYGLNDASSPKNVPFGVWLTTHSIIKGFKTPSSGRD